MIQLLKQLLVILLLAICAIPACKNDEHLLPGVYTKGIFISNEGPFMNGTGTVSFYDPEKKTIENNIFEVVNGRPLGNIVQSLEVFDNKVFVVVNNASKVEVVEAATFKSTGVIEGLASPRYFQGITSEKAYISDWAGHISIINLHTLTKTGTITTSHGPDRMLLAGSYLWVLNSAGMSSDSTVMVIDTSTDTPVQTIVVGDNPADLAQDTNGRIWIICGGRFDWENPVNNTHGALIKINPLNFNIEAKLLLDGTDFGPRIAVNGNGSKIFYSFAGGIYSRDASASVAQASELVLGQKCYALGIDPKTDEMYFSDPIDYAQPGIIYRYDVTGTTMIDSIKAGIIPGNWKFLK